MHSTIIEWLYPLLSVWVIIAYIHLVHLLHISDVVASRRLILVLFLPVVALEAYFSLRFPQPLAWADLGWGWVVSVVAKTLSWFVFFAVWVLFMNVAARKAVIVKWFITKFYLQLSLVFLAERWVAPLAFAAWLCTYHVVTVRYGLLRISTAMILPMVLCFALIFHLYHYGGVGERRRSNCGTGRKPDCVSNRCWCAPRDCSWRPPWLC